MAGGQNAVMDPNDRTIDLRPSTAKDFDFAWGLYRDLMKPLAEELMEWKEERQKVVVEREVVSGRASIIVAGGREVGWLYVREEANEIELCQLYIVPAQQNCGIGTEIMRRLMGEARRKSKPLILEVMKNNRACALYKRLGFIPTGKSKYKLQMAWGGNRSE